jgi:hypothetical protein
MTDTKTTPQITREYFAHCIECGYGVYKEDATLKLSSIGLERFKLYGVIRFSAAAPAPDNNYSVYHEKCYVRWFTT